MNGCRPLIGFALTLQTGLSAWCSYMLMMRTRLCTLPHLPVLDVVWLASLRLDLLLQRYVLSRLRSVATANLVFGVHVDNNSFIISVRLVLAREFSDAELWKRASSKPLMLAALVLPADSIPHIIRLHAAIPMCGCRRVLGQGSCDNARLLSLLRSGCWCLCG